MVFERIETLKREYTDKYVVVDESRPELARFKGQVGVVKTVNMSGRALIEFQDYIANIGWYDIDLDFVKVVPKPEAAAPTTEAKPAAKKAAPAKPAPTKPAATAPAAVQPVEKEPAAGEKKLSPIELARMQGAAKRAEGAAPAKPKPAVAEVGKSAATPAVGKKPSTAEILAAARTKKAAAVSELPEMPTSAIAEPPATEETATIAAETIPAETVAAATSDAAPAAPAPMKPKAIAPLAMAGPKPTTTAEKIAWCRANDAGRNAR